MYRYDHHDKVTSEFTDVCLGDQPANSSIKEVLQLEHVRNYGFSMHSIDSKDEYILEIDHANNKVRYIPIDVKLALQKKKRPLASLADRGSQEDV